MYAEQYFDDSIILLKNSINWEYKDMVNMKLNLHGNKSKLSDEERNILRQPATKDYKMEIDCNIWRQPAWKGSN